MTPPDPVGDPVERNRATPRRRVPGRAELGHPTTVRLLMITVATVVLATVVLAVVIVGAR